VSYCRSISPLFVEFEHRAVLFDAQEGRQESAVGLLSGLQMRFLVVREARSDPARTGWHWNVYHSGNRYAIRGKGPKNLDMAFGNHLDAHVMGVFRR
jgi:hypothetical protein